MGSGGARQEQEMNDIKQAVRDHVFADDSSEMLDRYLYHGRFSGAWFETIGGRGDAPEVADRLTPADIVAVSTLSVKIPGWAAVELLDRQAATLADLLAQVPRDVELHDAADADLQAVYELHDALDAIHDIGHVTRSKLLARKRPHLVPIRDQHVLIALIGEAHGNFTEPLRDALRDDPSLRTRLDDLRREASAASDLSLIRTLDIVVWMRTYGAKSIDPDL